jgi:hypothetical protein
MSQKARTAFAFAAALILLAFLVLPYLPTPEFPVKGNGMHSVALAAPAAVMVLNPQASSRGAQDALEESVPHRSVDVLCLTCTRLC